MRSNPFWGPDTKKGVLGPPVRLLSGPRCRSFLFRGKIPAPSIPFLFFLEVVHIPSLTQSLMMLRAGSDFTGSYFTGLYFTGSESSLPASFSLPSPPIPFRVFYLPLGFLPAFPLSHSPQLRPNVCPLTHFSFSERSGGTGRGIVIQSRMGYNLRR